MLVNCGNCRTPLQPPPGARAVRCAVCAAVTAVGSPSSSLGVYGLAPPPASAGRKKALICGISYRHTRNELKGCVNDAMCMKYLLISKFDFPAENVLVLTEDETDPYRIPTKHNMRMAIHWLVGGCEPGDSLVFHYSGHGSQQRNYNGDEIDGYDETLCPLDFETRGMIVDDEINATLVRPLVAGVKLHAIIDACHSGTVLDLPYLCRMNRSGDYVWEDHRPPSGVWKGSNGGQVFSFSGCDDYQSSADTSALSRITSTGAMTYCFIQAVERGQSGTYGSMLKSMRAAIKSIGSDLGGGVVTQLLAMLLSGGSLTPGGLKQEPQLTTCEPFDVFAEPFSL